MKLSWIFDTAPTALAVAAGISGGVLLLVSLVVGFARRKLHRAAETEGDVIQNYKRMDERRVLFRVGVTYQTPRTLLARIAPMVRGIIEAAGDVRMDRAHFAAFGDSSYDFEFVYYVLSSDYNVYMDVQQAINLAIVDAFEKEGIEFAYPTRTLHLQRPAQAAVAAA